MIVVTTTPANAAHFTRLLAFARDVLTACSTAGISPVLSSSLALFAYTGDQTMAVHDIDLSCSEAHFPHLHDALRSQGIDCTITTWHVLQARRDDLKIEFDATEYWLRDIPDDDEHVSFGDVAFRMVNPRSLHELYRRGFVATANADDPGTQAKHHAIGTKLRAIEAFLAQHETTPDNA